MRRRPALYGARCRDFRPEAGISRNSLVRAPVLNKIRENHLVCKKFYMQQMNGTGFDTTSRLLAPIPNVACLDDGIFKDNCN